MFLCISRVNLLAGFSSLARWYFFDGGRNCRSVHRVLITR